jgi:hypothetical protein
MSDYKKIILKNSPVPGAVPLEDFLDFGELALNYADKKLYYKELGGGIVVHETPYLDDEGSQNSVVKRNGDGSGVFNGVISNVSDPDLYALDISSSASTTARVSALNTQTAINASAVSGIGANINSASGIGANINSASGIGAIISSGSSTAAVISSNSSTYHAEFGTITTNNSSAIERIRGAFVWFYNTFKGRLQTANITANRNWTLPDRSGTILLDSSIRSGKTIYVDAGVGTDTRNGFTAYSYTPFATISAAVTASSPGDLVYVRAGSYAISAQINLNLEGHLYFEPGATVNVATGVTAFSFNQATNDFPVANSIRIQGHADFVLTGSAGILTIPTSNNTSSPPIVAFECNSITGPSSASGTLFNIVNGVLSVDAKTIAMTTTFTASNATVFNITGTGDVTARIPFVYCGKFVSSFGSPGAAARAQINADIWTLVTYNATAGMDLRLITTNFRIVNYNHVGVGAAFNWTENTTTEAHGFQGITWSSLAGQPHITFASTAASTTNKRIRLYQTNIMRAAATNSLSSNVPINVGTYGTFASVSATSNITFKIGSFTVDTDVNTY